MSYQDLHDFATDCLASPALDEKRRDVITRRYGIGCEPETLESIGRSGRNQEKQVSRQYMSSLHLDSLKKLSRLFRERADLLVKGNVDAVWERTPYGLMIPKAKSFQDPMHGPYLLAWHLTTGEVRKLSEWLEDHALGYEACWVDKRIDGIDAEIRRLSEAAAPLVKALAKPWPANAIAKQLDCSDDRLLPLLTAAFPKQRWNEVAGYIFHGRNTRRPRRAAFLHAVLKHRMRDAVCGIRAAGEQYRASVPSDQCYERDLLIVAGENPHLFLEVGSANLSAIGMPPVDHLGTIPALSSPPDEADMDDSESGDSESESSNADRIAELLTKAGPLRLSTIMESLDIPKGTVSGTIGQNYRFVRVLPGIYGNEDQISSINLSQQAQADALFNESEVLRIYIRARFAGEPFELFPLWGWEFEYRLALWAERHGSDQLPALLAIAEPSNWPAPMDVIETWVRKKRLRAHYEPGERPKLAWTDATRKSLDAGHVLGALLLVKDRGHLSVVSCSMVMAADGPDSSVGTLLLMLLVATGCVSPGATWQSAHPCTEMADRWNARLGEDLANHHGELDWSSASAEAFLDAARAWNPTDATWFDADELSELLARLDASRVAKTRVSALTTPISHTLPPVSAPPAIVSIEATMPEEDHSDIVTTERLRELAQAKDPEAMYLLSQRTRIGDGTPANPTMAIYWLRRASASGHSRAQEEVQALPTIPLPAMPAGRGRRKNTVR